MVLGLISVGNKSAKYKPLVNICLTKVCMSIHGVQKSGCGAGSVDILSSIQPYGACETAVCAVSP